MRIFLAAALLSLAAAAAKAGEDCMFQDVDALVKSHFFKGQKNLFYGEAFVANFRFWQTHRG